jgi:hypothetical protein
MPTAPASPQSKPNGAVFLSYASQDAQAARRIGAGLRAARIEVWFDESELRGGDAWDDGIRTGIHDCTLFIPVISAHTQARPEGYFRLEWKLAVERSHLMAAERAFLLPVVVDSTSAPAALVPERFRELQWTYLPEGAPSREFIDRVLRLLAQPLLTRQRDEAATPGVKARRRDQLSLWVAAASAAIVILYVAVEHFPWRARPNEGVSQSDPRQRWNTFVNSKRRTSGSLALPLRSMRSGMAAKRTRHWMNSSERSRGKRLIRSRKSMRGLVNLIRRSSGSTALLRSATAASVTSKRTLYSLRCVRTRVTWPCCAS